MSRPTPFALSALLIVLLSATALPAKPGRVAMKDGKVWEGDVTERPQDKQIDVVVDGKKYTFSTANVARPVEYDDSIEIKPVPTPGQPQPQPAQPQPAQPQPQPGQAQPGQPLPGGTMTPDQDFEKRRSMVANNDATGLIRLARWAFDHQMYDHAYDAAKDAADADPRNREAQDLLRTVDAQRRLARKQGQPVTPGGQRPAQAAPNGRDGQMPADRTPRNDNAKRGAPTGDNGLVRPLSPDEVNRIRVLEWHGDRGVKIRLLNDVKRRYLARADMQPAQFNKLDAVDQAWEIKKKGNAELLNDIRLTNDPPAMQEYRTVVQRAVLATCATAACHGGGAGSDRFALLPKADHEAEAYANFLTLNKYQYKPAKGREASMIDRNRPEDSLLIQFGLAPNISNMPHPDVEGYKPIFRTLNDQKYKQFVRWIAKDLSPMISDYGVPFDQQADRGADHRANGNQPAGDAAPGDDAAPGAGGGAGATPAGAGAGAGSGAGTGAGAGPAGGATQPPPRQGGAR